MKKGFRLTLLALVLTAAVIALPSLYLGFTEKNETETSTIDKSKHNIVSKPDQTSSKPPETSVITRDDTVTFLVELEEKALIDTVIASQGKYGSVNDLLHSGEGKSCCDAIKKSQAVAKASIRKLVTKSDFTGSKVLSAVMNGLTVKAPLSTKEKIEKINGVKAVYVFYGNYEVFDRSDDSAEVTQTDEISGTVPSQQDELSELSRSEDNGSLTESSQTESSEISGEDNESSGEVSESSEESMDENAATTAAMTGLYQQSVHLSEAYENGYDGSGMLIAVLDSEFSVRHEAFLTAPSKTAVTKADIRTLMSQVSFNTVNSVSADQLYRSSKIVYAYDYADDDINTSEPALNHGTAVAAAAAGNNGKTDENAFRGVAYQAQLALMKIASPKDGDNIRIEKSIMLSALDDAVKLGADVINLSFGSYELPDNEDLMSSIFDKLGKTDTLLVCSSGNAGYNGQQTQPDVKPDTRDIHYGTENRLSAADGVVAAGSFGTGWKIRHFMTVHSEEITYQDCGSVSLSEEYDSDELPYLFKDMDGAESDYEGLEASGKLIIVRQGELPAEELVRTAYLKDAAALGVIGSETDEWDSLGNSSFRIPVILIDQEQESFFESEPAGSVRLYSYRKLYQESETIRVSSFNSYHLGSDLQFDPQLLAPGESVCTASPDGGYRLMTGTSVTAPCVAGFYSLVKQYFSQNDYFKKMDSVTLRHQITAALLSNGNVIAAGNGKNLYESPRLQGSGAADWQQLMQSGAYLTTTDGHPAVIALGDGEKKQYQFSFLLKNYSSTEKTYTASGVLQTDGCTHTAEGTVRNTLKPSALGGFSIAITVKGQNTASWTVPAYGTLTLQATITVDQETAQNRLLNFPNGYYIDGYVFLEEEATQSRLNLPFSGFYGDWDGMSPFDATVYDDTESITGFDNTLVAVAVQDKSYTALPLTKCEKGLSFSRESVRCATDDPSYGYAFILPDLNPLCDLYDYTAVMKDSTGKEVFTLPLGNLSHYRDPDYRSYEKLADHFYESEKLFAPLTDGVYEYILTAGVKDATGRIVEKYRQSFSVVIDTEAPSCVNSRTYVEDGKIYLALSARDNNAVSDYLFYAAAYNSTTKSYDYTDSLDELIHAGYISENSYRLISRETDKKGVVTFLYDITNLEEELNKLKIRTSSWSSRSSTHKIVYRAFDTAGNCSDAGAADTIVYGSATFRFIDQNQVPAEGITVTLGHTSLMTDKTGTVVFEKLLPDDYRAAVSCDETLYLPERREYIVTISNGALHAVFSQNVEFKGEYPSEEPSEEQSLSSDQESSEGSAVSRLSSDNPIYALILIGTLLLICVISLVMRKHYFKK